MEGPIKLKVSLLQPTYVISTSYICIMYSTHAKPSLRASSTDVSTSIGFLMLYPRFLHIHNSESTCFRFKKQKRKQKQLGKQEKYRRYLVIQPLNDINEDPGFNGGHIGFNILVNVGHPRATPQKRRP
jgi:hypothetical protein